MENRKVRREFAQSEEARAEYAYELWGWILFSVCAVLFIVSAIRNQDLFTLVGSVLFLVSCVLFLIPLAKKMRGGNDRIRR